MGRRRHPQCRELYRSSLQLQPHPYRPTKRGPASAILKRLPLAPLCPRHRYGSRRLLQLPSLLLSLLRQLSVWHHMGRPMLVLKWLPRFSKLLLLRKRSKPPRIESRLPTNVSAHQIPIIHRDCLQLQLLPIRRFHQLQQCSEPNQSSPRQFCLLCQWLLLPRPYRPRQCKPFIQLPMLLVLPPRSFHRPHTLLLQDSFLLRPSLGLPTTSQDIPLKASRPPPGPLLRLIQPHTLPD